MARQGLYQPFIQDRNVRRLYQLKVCLRESAGRHIPMTVLVNAILDDFFVIGWASDPSVRALQGAAPADLEPGSMD